ncbi:DUF3102 domain-containing protein [Siccirubricoccus sp. G192]|uniref:DUF3102 domain-containing protein n=1 Tax=Siccirubricoccus sp. G192 TaxID=2849651 RepID=UPI001C2C8B66|nr:DUF3102 domain-containing protein [Siccirubricoccus sp. G192]MBV1800557.1 DUF3102 domain-containing protein [Siccirubricoccus sp. G192]
MTGFRLPESARRRKEPGGILPEHQEAKRQRLLSNHVKECHGTADFVSEIGKLWEEAQAKFLTIGRYLVQAKEGLPHGEFESMVANQLPFGRSVAYQLRMVAQAVEQRRIAEDDLPRSYTNAYKLVLLDDGALRRAHEAKVVRPDVSRRELTEFLNKIKAGSQQGTPEQERRAQRIAWLLSRAKALSHEMAQIQAELHALSGGIRDRKRAHHH